MLSPVLRKDGFLGAVDQCRRAGAKVLAGGHMTGLDGRPDPEGVWAAPTVVRVEGIETAATIPAVTTETFFPLISVVVAEPADDEPLLTAALAFLGANAYGLRNSLWSRDPEVIDRVATELANGGLLKINDSHVGFVPPLPTRGGTGLTSGPFGEGAFPMVLTSHVQGISIATDVTPREAVFD
ncbi:aldehyde dehydrogenase family protein [Streptomyces sp. TRM66268-LWL]|uniref:Aldehyde dehydrogenase family protein n=1 Tax=Streptomyces polyasparticus TaxID=2767826 RepID=A0ABR7SCR2_9ACTN|nr:aldehyde dehydrogenase family protein [Streptomyces polyasparticus]MBC9713270.1 aldehyde dehydrogenase family protein [Streptomyces polyasparticus]